MYDNRQLLLRNSFIHTHTQQKNFSLILSTSKSSYQKEIPEKKSFLSSVKEKNLFSRFWKLVLMDVKNLHGEPIKCVKHATRE